MAKTIVVRGVADRLHRKLTARAAAHGLSLSDHALAELRRLAGRLSPRELAARSGRIVRADLEPSPAAILRAERARCQSSPSMLPRAKQRQTRQRRSGLRLRSAGTTTDPSSNRVCLDHGKLRRGALILDRSY
jgi:plasmid stability protein